MRNKECPLISSSLTVIITFMIMAGLCGALLLFGFLAFFFNIVMSVGLNGVIGIFSPSKLKTKDLLPPSQ